MICVARSTRQGLKELAAELAVDDPLFDENVGMLQGHS